jgi:ribonuclease HI
VAGNARAAKKIADRHKIEWLWVRGHAGDAKNEYVHHLAVQAARGQQDSKGLIDSGFGAWLEAQQEKGRFLDFFDLPPKNAPNKKTAR